MTDKISRLPGVLVLGFLLLCSATNGALATNFKNFPKCTQDVRTYSRFLEVSIFGSRPTKYTLHDIKRLLAQHELTPTTQNVVFISGSGSTRGSWSGVLLWDFLQLAGFNPEGRNPQVQTTIEVGGTDCYFIRFGAGEIAPSFGQHNVILTLFQDGELLDDFSGFARLIFPGDKSGARNVSQISWIRVY